MDSSSSIILLPKVWAPSTQSMLLSFIVKFVLYCHVKRSKINKKGLGLFLEMFRSSLDIWGWCIAKQSKQHFKGTRHRNYFGVILRRHECESEHCVLSRWIILAFVTCKFYRRLKRPKIKEKVTGYGPFLTMPFEKCYLEPVRPDWANFEISRWQILIQKYPTYLETFWAILKRVTFYVKLLWLLFGQI